MAKVNTTCEVSTYDEPAKAAVIVNSHWSRENMIVVHIGDKSRTVLASDLKKAIENCTNVGF